MKQVMKTRFDQLLHDVRNPLNTISMNAELARLLGQTGTSPEKLQKALAVIVNECKRCDTILESFRTELQNETDANTP